MRFPGRGGGYSAGNDLLKSGDAVDAGEGQDGGDHQRVVEARAPQRRVRGPEPLEEGGDGDQADRGEQWEQEPGAKQSAPQLELGRVVGQQPQR